MGERLGIDLFCEDRAHEEFLRALLQRLCRAEEISADIEPRSARGGHGRALSELKLYQEVVKIGRLAVPDLLVAAIDSNCRPFQEARDEVEVAIDPAVFPHRAIACPNPHVELWYLADAQAFKQVVGVAPPPVTSECGGGKQTRRELKQTLQKCIRKAGRPVLFGGVQFARELAAQINIYRVGRVDRGFHHFVTDARASIRQLKHSPSN